MVALDLRGGRLFGMNILDLLVILGIAGLMYFSANSPRYFESMKGDVEGISGDYFALQQKGYGLSVVVKGEGNELSGRVVDAERDRLYVFDGARVFTVCSARGACDVSPLVIRAYAVPERRTVSVVNAASLGELGALDGFLSFSVYVPGFSGNALALRDALSRGVSGSVEAEVLDGSLKLAFRDALPSDVPVIRSLLSGQELSLSPVSVAGVA